MTDETKVPSERRNRDECKRDISHAEAREIAQRLINSHFHQEPHARITIPAQVEHDDDLLAMSYIDQQARRDLAYDEAIAALVDGEKALAVLETMCRSAGLPLGQDTAHQMLDRARAILSSPAAREAVERLAANEKAAAIP